MEYTVSDSHESDTLKLEECKRLNKEEVKKVEVKKKKSKKDE